MRSSWTAAGLRCPGRCLGGAAAHDISALGLRHDGHEKLADDTSALGLRRGGHEKLADNFAALGLQPDGYEKLADDISALGLRHDGYDKLADDTSALGLRHDGHVELVDAGRFALSEMLSGHSVYEVDAGGNKAVQPLISFSAALVRASLVQRI